MDALLIDIDRWASSKKILMMDPLEELGYFHLLMAAAKSGDCGLPDDDNQLAALSKLGKQWFKITKEPLKRIVGQTSGVKLRLCFFPGGSADPTTGEISGFIGRIYNSRLLQSHRSYLKTSDQKRKAALARWGNRSDAVASEPQVQPDNRLVSNNGCGIGSGFLEESTAEENVSVADFKFLKGALTKYFDGDMGEAPSAIVHAVMEAGGGASVREIYDHLKWLHQHNQAPKDPAGPKTWGWFVTVVAAKFSGRRVA